MLPGGIGVQHSSRHFYESPVPLLEDNNNCDSLCKNVLTRPQQKEGDRQYGQIFFVRKEISYRGRYL